MTIPKTMRASFMYGVGEIRVEDAPVPVPAADEVLIRVRAVGLCGSDVHLFSDGRVGPYIVEPPYTLGHEAAGEVAAVGAEVKTLKPGDRVTMEPGIPCGECEFCRSGRYNLCTKVQFWAAPPVPGVIAEYITHKAGFCFKIADSVPFDTASMAEPISVGVFACQRSGAMPGKTAAVTGAGPIGQTAVQALLNFGVREILVSDVVESRLNLAAETGAKRAVNAKKEDLAAAAAEFTEGKGFDLVFETSGSPAAAADAVKIVKNGATVILIGNTPEVVNFPLLEVIQKELRVFGSFRYANTYPTVVDILASNDNLSRLISHRFSIEETQKAFELARDDKEGCMKIIVEV